ncbi:helix-turn-helix transcriptional regulator [Paenibacillus humicola]|uniref:helix-turn-helix transcriptional regulator n=1 Tax=Paenibacillus humicola TaxID=3110540 RepID=UPI00237A2DF8|nr:YafY family protein [Paenibacillus humicola]
MKLDRLLAITMLLLNRRRVGAKELADRFEVSLRTIYRDLETINQAGIPIVSYAGANGGYEIMDQYRIERQYLSLDELQSIIIALQGMRSSYDEQDIGALLDKVGALTAKAEPGAVTDPHGQLIVDINPWHAGSREDKEMLADLKTAIRSTRLIRFSYTTTQGEDSERMCEPMGIVLKGYRWYLYGYCLLRRDYRIFRLSRIDRLTVLEETFTRREKTLEQLDYRWNRTDDPPELVRLVLRFHPRAKARVRDYFDPSRIETEADGSLLVTAEQPDEDWLYGMLLGYGPDVKVLEPESVARKVTALAGEIVRLYEKSAFFSLT